MHRREEESEEEECIGDKMEWMLGRILTWELEGVTECEMKMLEKYGREIGKDECIGDERERMLGVILTWVTVAMGYWMKMGGRFGCMGERKREDGSAREINGSGCMGGCREGKQTLGSV